MVGWPWGRGHRGWGDAQGAQDSVTPHAAPAPPNTHLHEPPDSSCQEQRLSTNPQLAGSQAGEFCLGLLHPPGAASWQERVRRSCLSSLKCPHQGMGARICSLAPLQQGISSPPARLPSQWWGSGSWLIKWSLARRSAGDETPFCSLLLGKYSFFFFSPST